MTETVQLYSPPVSKEAIILDYLPNDPVYVIDTCEGKPYVYVTQGTVIYIRAEVNITSETIVYNIKLDGTNEVKEFSIDNVFTNKTEALAEYLNRF